MSEALQQQRSEAIAAVREIMQQHLTAHFSAERFIELLDAAGFDIIRRQGVSMKQHFDEGL